MQQVIVDTGPLVALLDRQDQHHDWVRSQIKNISPPLLSCEAVIVETCFLLSKHDPSQIQRIFNALNTGFLEIPFALNNESLLINEFLKKYADVPMSLADACLVRMSELYPQALVFTLDSDFHIYRKNRNESISCLIPPER